MKTHVRVAISLMIALVCGLSLGVTLKWRAWAQHLSPLVAYTATAVETAVDPDGTERYRYVRSIAQSSSGSVAIDEHRYYKTADGVSRSHPVRFIKDTNARRLVSIYPLVGARITAQLNDQSVQSLASKPAAGCIDGMWTLDEQAPAQTLAGHAVIVRQRQLLSGDGAHRGPQERQWVAPGLDCLVMRRESKTFDEQGKLRGTVLMNVTNVALGEPAVAKFEIPANLQEMSPSEVMNAQNNLFGIECSECSRNALENADRRYYAKKPTSN